LNKETGNRINKKHFNIWLKSKFVASKSKSVEELSYYNPSLVLGYFLKQEEQAKL